LKFRAFELGGSVILQGYAWNFSNPFIQALFSSGKKGRNIFSQISVRGAAGGGEGVVSKHQELKAHLLGSLEGEGMIGGRVPTAAERSSSARGFQQGSGAMLRSRSCNKRRGSYWCG
jgi:hypothetical protein